MKRIIWTIFLCGLFLIGGQGEENIYNREVMRFDSGHFKIAGDLHIPNPDKKQPAIIFVHGDGPARRSPSGRPNRIMRSFLDIGFACFYYDKPGYGESRGTFTRGKLFEERASILVDAVKVLKRHPAINPEQIGLWGISQAGYVMPKAITATKDIAFMIAISCPAMDSVEQSAYLVEKQILCGGYDEAEAKVEAYEKALKKAGNRNYQVELFPEADHVIFIAKTGCMKEQRERYRSSYAPGYIELMQTWLESLIIPDF